MKNRVRKMYNSCSVEKKLGVPLMKRVYVVAGGVVQGVCFRYYAQRRAEELGVTGWVRNLSDGRIEAIFEGDDADVDSIVNWFRHGPPGALVREFSIDQQPYRGEFGDFSVGAYWR